MILIILVAAFLFADTSSAFAYLDPGTGSIILQGIIGSIAGAMVVGRLYWHRIKKFFGARSDDDTEPNQ